VKNIWKNIWARRALVSFVFLAALGIALVANFIWLDPFLKLKYQLSEFRVPIKVIRLAVIDSSLLLESDVRSRASYLKVAHSGSSSTTLDSDEVRFELYIDRLTGSQKEICLSVGEAHLSIKRDLLEKKVYVLLNQLHSCAGFKLVPREVSKRGNALVLLASVDLDPTFHLAEDPFFPLGLAMKATQRPIRFSLNDDYSDAAYDMYDITEWPTTYTYGKGGSKSFMFQIIPYEIQFEPPSSSDNLHPTDKLFTLMLQIESSNFLQIPDESYIRSMKVAKYSIIVALVGLVFQLLIGVPAAIGAFLRTPRLS